LIRASLIAFLLFLQLPQLPVIPNSDVTGTCLVFQRLRVEAGLLEMAHLSPNDEREATRTITEFFQDFRAYSMGLDRGAITRRDFIAMRDNLVARTCSQMSARLTKEGWTRLSRFIQQQSEHPKAPPRRKPNPNVIET